MAEPWMKIGTELLRNPKVGKAGRDGLIVFLEVLAAVNRSDRDGRVPAREVEPKHLAGLLFQWRMTPKKVERALDSLVKASLLERIPTGGFFVVGWDDYWKPPYTAAERKARERRKRREDAGLEPKEEDAESLKRHAPSVTESRAQRDTRHDACHAPKVGREEGSKEGRKAGREDSDAPLFDDVGVPREELARIRADAERLASRETHPLGVHGFERAAIAAAWHPRIARGEVDVSRVPLCYVDYLLDPSTGKLLERPFDPAEEPGRLAELAERNHAAWKRRNRAAG